MMDNKPERVTKLLTVKSNEEKSKLAKLAYQKLVKFSKEKACHGQITDKDISNPVNTLFLLEEALKGNDSFIIVDSDSNQKEVILKTFKRYINKEEYKELPFDIFVNDRSLRAVSKEDKSDKNTGVIFIYDIYDLKWCKGLFDNLKSNLDKGYIKHLWINFDPYQYVKEIKPLIEKDIHIFYTSDKRIVSKISKNPNVQILRYVAQAKPKIGINHKKHKNCISLYEYYRDVLKRRIHNYNTDFEFITIIKGEIMYKYAENSPINVIKNTLEPFPEENRVRNMIQLGQYMDRIECDHIGFNVYNKHTLQLLDSRVVFSVVRAMMGLKSTFYCDKENERLVRFKIGYYIYEKYPHFCHKSIWENIIFESGADIKEIKDMMD